MEYMVIRFQLSHDFSVMEMIWIYWHKYSSQLMFQLSHDFSVMEIRMYQDATML